MEYPVDVEVADRVSDHLLECEEFSVSLTSLMANVVSHHRLPLVLVLSDHELIIAMASNSIQKCLPLAVKN